MFKIEETNIQITRGDTGVISLLAEDLEGRDHMFDVGDVIRMKVFEKKNCNNVVLQKMVIVEEKSTSIDILLTSEDTKIGEIINKPVDYWYEIELNPDTNPQTILAYDDDGAKIFTLYTEGGDISE